MKSNVNTKKTINLSVGLLGLILGAVLALVAVSYRDASMRVTRCEAEARLADKLVETQQINKLIRQLNRGEAAEAKRSLNTSLAYNLSVIDSLASGTTARYQDFAKFVVAKVKRDERAHPDYYLARLQTAGFNGDTIQMVRH